jgi:hypothetical protein
VGIAGRLNAGEDTCHRPMVCPGADADPGIVEACPTR